jgi:hypothetical protein
MGITVPGSCISWACKTWVVETCCCTTETIKDKKKTVDVCLRYKIAAALRCCWELTDFYKLFLAIVKAGFKYELSHFESFWSFLKELWEFCFRSVDYRQKYFWSVTPIKQRKRHTCETKLCTMLLSAWEAPEKYIWDDIRSCPLSFKDIRVYLPTGKWNSNLDAARPEAAGN